jgi:opacity protein-like surface antigen
MRWIFVSSRASTLRPGQTVRRAPGTPVTDTTTPRGETMKTMPFILAAAALALAASDVRAQDCDCDDWDDDYPEDYHRRPTGGYAGGAFSVAAAQGEFRDHVDGAFGGQMHYLHRLDRTGLLGIRIDGGMLIYGYERYRVPLSSTIGGRILVDVNTSNNIAYLGIGPQLGLPDGRLRPYVNGFAGVSYIFTGSSVEGSSDHHAFANTTNFDDWAFSYGGGAGVYVPLRGGASPVSLDLGMTYRRNGEAEYLLEGGIRDNPDGSITLFPVRSRTDMLTFQLGVSVGISR